MEQICERYLCELGVLAKAGVYSTSCGRIVTSLHTQMIIAHEHLRPSRKHSKTAQRQHLINNMREHSVLCKRK